MRRCAQLSTQKKIDAGETVVVDAKEDAPVDAEAAKVKLSLDATSTPAERLHNTLKQNDYFSLSKSAEAVR